MSYNKASIEASYTPDEPTLGEPDTMQAGESCNQCTCM